MKNLSRLIFNVSICIVSPYILADNASNSVGIQCGYDQSNPKLLPVLANSCPIGDGLWQDMQPSSANSTFWIQCGFFDKPLSKPSALKDKLGIAVWNKASEEGNRCLLGPFSNYQLASFALRQVKSLPNYEDAFLREILIEPNSQDSSVFIKRSTVLSKSNIIIPFFKFSDSSRIYKDKNEEWYRYTYTEAKKTCNRIGMKIASKAQLELAIQDDWPEKLPYWTDDMQAYSKQYSNKNISRESLLNLACAKSRTRHTPKQY